VDAAPVDGRDRVARVDRVDRVGGGDPAELLDYDEAVLALVEQVPRGRVTTYGAIADALFDAYGGGPRQVARVMSLGGAPVPWWRCVRSDGTLPSHLLDQARQAWLEEATPLRASGAVDVRRALWVPGVTRLGSSGSSGSSRPPGPARPAG
jgi:alkylated DNA nucleotide flippase Atl1